MKTLRLLPLAALFLGAIFSSYGVSSASHGSKAIAKNVTIVTDGVGGGYDARPNDGPGAGGGYDTRPTDGPGAGGGYDTRPTDGPGAGGGYNTRPTDGAGGGYN